MGTAEKSKIKQQLRKARKARSVETYAMRKAILRKAAGLRKGTGRFSREKCADCLFYTLL